MCRSANLDRVTHFAVQLGRESLPKENGPRIITWPRTIDFPPTVRTANAGYELFLAKGKRFCKISAKQRHFAAIFQTCRDRQHGGKTYDVVPPEHPLDLG